MRLEEEIRRMICEYPMLYHNRAEALGHLFGGLGNGYTWVDGELVELQDEREGKGKRDPIAEYDLYVEKQRKELSSILEHPLASEQFEKMWREHRKEMVQTLSEIDTRVKESPIPKAVYPLYEMASMFNMPKDVKADWFNGAFEYASIVVQIDPDYVLPTGHKNQDSINLAKRFLQRV